MVSSRVHCLSFCLYKKYKEDLSLLYEAICDFALCLPSCYSASKLMYSLLCIFDRKYKFKSVIFSGLPKVKTQEHDNVTQPQSR